MLNVSSSHTYNTHLVTTDSTTKAIGHAVCGQLIRIMLLDEQNTQQKRTMFLLNAIRSISAETGTKDVVRRLMKTVKELLPHGEAFVYMMASVGLSDYLPSLSFFSSFFLSFLPPHLSVVSPLVSFCFPPSYLIVDPGQAPPYQRGPRF